MTLGYDVPFFEDVEKAWNWLDEYGAELVAVVLDVMLPHGQRYSAAATQKGLLTGLFVYRELRAKFGQQLPIFFLTNSANPVIGETIKDDANALLYLKPKVYYDEFGKALKDRLENA